MAINEYVCKFIGNAWVSLKKFIGQSIYEQSLPGTEKRI